MHCCILDWLGVHLGLCLHIVQLCSGRLGNASVCWLGFSEVQLGSGQLGLVHGCLVGSHGGQLGLVQLGMVCYTLLHLLAGPLFSLVCAAWCSL